MKNERRLIDVNKPIKETESIINFRKQHYMPTEDYESFLDYLKKRPTVDAVEVVHGHWTATDVIVHKAGYGVRYYYHAECKVNPHRLFECENDYCPNCGAKMDGDGNG